MRLSDRITRLFQTRSSDSGSPGFGRTTALVTGSVALGALITGAVIEKTRRTRLPLPTQLAPALDYPVHEMEIMEGKARYYKREGKGTPIVLLHSINAAGSSFEMKPIFERFARTTERPIYALDWFGFGLSDRPPVRYRPGLYQRQLRRFLSEHVKETADVLALSLACEYAATIANAFPMLIGKLVFITPTALGRSSEGSLLQKTLVGMARNTGAFEVFYSRLTQRESLRHFYEEEIFSPEAPPPHELVNYAFLTSHIRGAHHAPALFVEGALFMKDYAWRTYTHLATPTLIVLPKPGTDTVQDFDRATELKGINPLHVDTVTLETGLLPQWENNAALMEAVEAFLSGTTK